ncbi:M20 family metallopeptidase [Oceanobacillus zhaokaii]
MKDPYTPQVLHGGEWGYEEDVIRGRGLTEQVASLAAATAAMNALATSQEWSGRPIELGFATTVSGETGDHASAEHVVSMLGRAPTWTVVCVATNCQVGIGNKGRVDVHLETQGKSSHSSAPENGKNALVDACKVIQVLGRETLPVHHELGNATLTPIAIRSFPESPHTIPDRCSVTLDRRLNPGEDPSQVIRSIERALEPFPELNISVQPGKYMYPNQLDPHSPLCLAAVDAVNSNDLNGITVYQKSAQDAGYFTHIGSETLCLGPGDRRFAHTEVEVVPIRHVQKMAQAYLDVLLTLGKGDS